MIYYPIEKILARFTDAIITINKEDYYIAKKFRLRAKGKVYYVPGVGIDLSKYNNSLVNKKEQRELLGLKEKNIVLISVGDLNENKNNILIINALSKMRNPNIHYLVCGNGELEDSLKSIVKEKKLNNNVHFLGYRTDIKELLLISDIFVMPSFREGLSRSIMEAMACGLPCIVSRIRGNVDLIKDGKGGFLCDTKFCNELIDDINNIISDKNMSSMMAEYNLNIIHKYSVNTIKNKMKMIYNDAIFSR